MTDARVARIGGKVRAARLTDLAALGELSRLSQTEGSGARSLGLPVNGPPIGMFSLFRLPLVAFRPHDLLLVYEADRRVAGLKILDVVRQRLQGGAKGFELGSGFVAEEAE